MNMKKKYVKPQVECYVINNPCLLMVSPANTVEEDTDDAPDFGGELG